MMTTNDLGWASDTSETMAMEALRELAAQKQHRLHPDMLSKRLTPTQADAIYRNLTRCPDKEAVTVSEPQEQGAKFPPPMSAFAHIPAGRYATPSRTGNNDYDFWQIARPESGKWAGFTFVERVIGGRENVPVKGMAARYACQAIVEYGIETASYRFGQELGVCGDCGRHLTDEESRAIGKGPICRSK